jgi:hypothetical protein
MARVTPLTASDCAPDPAGSTGCVKHRIARHHIARRLPWFMPRTWIVLLLGTPIARPFLRRAYDRYMQSRTHPKHARGMPSVH